MSTVKDLTGGSNDLNPQQFSIRLEQQNVDDTVQEVVDFCNCQIPVPNGKALVMEVLSTTFNQSPVYSSNDQATMVCSTAQKEFIGPTTALPAPSRGGADGFISRTVNAQTVITAVGALDRVDLDTQYNHTDNAGHGIIVPGKKLYFVLDSAFAQTLLTCDFSVLFRWKFIDLQEFLTLMS